MASTTAFRRVRPAVQALEPRLLLAAQPYEWRNAPIHGGGFVSGLVTNPTEPGLVYARTDIGGAYRFNDASDTWVPLVDHLGRDDWNLYGIESIASDPVEPNRVYLAAGTYVQSWASTGAILRSADYGQTWTRTNVPFKFGGNEDGRSNGERLAVDPNLNSTLYLGTRQNGLWRSTDFGANWAQVTSFPVSASTPNGIGTVFVQFDKSTGTAGNATQTIYAGVSSTTTSLYRSTNGGATWQAIPNQPTGLVPHHAALSGNGMLYVTYGNGPGPNNVTSGAVWRFSTTTGAWANVTPPTGQGGFAGVSVDPVNPNTLIVSTIDRWWPRDEIYRSTNAGANWVGLRGTGASDNAIIDTSSAPWAAAKSPHWLGDIEIDPHNPNRAMFVTGYGVFTSENLTAADSGQRTRWSFTSRGLEETVVNDVVSPPSGPSQVISAMWDLNGFRHTDVNNPTPPTNYFTPDLVNNRDLDFAESNPDVLARTSDTWDGVVSGAYSLNGGTSWTQFATKPPGASGLQNGGGIAVSADGDTFVWSPVNAAMSWSTSRGQTWTASTGLPRNGLEPVADRVNGDRFYAYDPSGGAMYVSNNSGQSFTRLPPTLATGGTTPRALPGAEGHLLLPTPSGLFRSTNGGTSWLPVPGVQQAWEVGIGKPAPGRTNPAIFVWGRVGNVNGIHRTDDDGATWWTITDAQHQFGSLSAIAGDPRIHGRVYLASTHRGVLVGDVAAPPPTVTGVYVSSTAWTTAYLNRLQNTGQGSSVYGYALNGSEQLDELPWSNLNKVSVRFSRDVNVTANQLAVAGINVAGYGVAGFAYDPVTFTATWTLDRAIPNDKVTITLDADAGTGGVRAVTDGEYLDGEWFNPLPPTPAFDTFPSGNGAAGGDFVFTFRALPGDINRDGSVNIFDFNVMKPNLNVTGAGVLGGDVNGDDVVNVFDFNEFKPYLGRTTPA